MGPLAEFAGSHPYLALGVAISLVAVIVYELRLRAQGSTQVSAAEAVRLINRGAMVIDVRKPEEFGGGHILHARNIQLAEIEKDPSVVKKRKDKVLLTVCEHGASSAKAAALLRSAGFQSVYSLKSGLASWRLENLPIVK